MFYKNVERLLHSKKFPIVNPDDALCTIYAINMAKPPRYPHSAVAHLLALSCHTIDVSNLELLISDCLLRGWRPSRVDASDYEKICLKKIAYIIDNYGKKKEKKNH